MKPFLFPVLVSTLLIAGCSVAAQLMATATAVPTEPPTVAPTQPPPPTSTSEPSPKAPEPTEGAAAGTAGPTTAPTDTPTEAPTQTPAASPTPATAFITYQDFEIVPARTSIKVGTTVVFLIKAGFLVSHQPYNFVAPNVFESPPNLGDGASWSFTFNEAGTITIRCGYHAEMVATLEITP